MENLSQFFLEGQLTMWDNLEFVFRILLSGLLGIVIGTERSRRQKEAGIRTHFIIAVSAALLMIVSKYAFLDVGLGDPARIAAQVVSGISFLGAGVIFRQKASVKGLTTAAGMWGTAAVGLAVGAGLYWVGGFVAASLVSIQVILHRHPVAGDGQVVQEIVVTMSDEAEIREALWDLLVEHCGEVESSDLRRENDVLHVKLSVRLEEPVRHEEAMQLLRAYPGIRHISV